MLPSVSLGRLNETPDPPGRRGDRFVHDVPGVKHWAQGACPRVDVQSISDSVLGFHLAHLLRTMDRPRMVMHLHCRNATASLKFTLSYLHLRVLIPLICCSCVGIVLMFVGLYVVLWAKNMEDKMFAELTVPSETECDIERPLLQ